MDAGGMTSFRSILDKPLKDLTEDDISQLTREDCRNFLKLKGMRRPSWNKSQAIQQVICLKALLESTHDSGASALRKITANQLQAVSNSADSVKEASEVGNTVGRADEYSPYRRKDPLWSSPPRDLVSRLIDQDVQAVRYSPRSPHETNEPVGQMTIFYCGKVNVYDGVPPDKARSIMQLAAMPVNLPQDDSVTGSTALFSFPCHLQTAGEQNGSSPASAILCPSMQGGKLKENPFLLRDKGNTSHELGVEGPASRKVSLQRYLEKRKDRGRLKSRKDAGLTSPCMEMYSSHRAWIPISNAQPNRTGTTCPNKHGMPNMPNNSADRHSKTAGLPVDLNSKGYLQFLFASMMCPRCNSGGTKQSNFRVNDAYWSIC